MSENNSGGGEGKVRICAKRGHSPVGDGSEDEPKAEGGKIKKVQKETGFHGTTPKQEI